MLVRVFRMVMFLTLAAALAACNLPVPAPAPEATQATGLPDLAATLTALVPTAAATGQPDLAATLTALAPTGAPSVTAMVQPTAAQQQPTAAQPTAAQQQPGGIPVVQITPVATLGPVVYPTAKPTSVVTAGVTPVVSTPITNKTRITFDRFATSKVISSSLAQGETRSYVLQVGGGQILMVDVGSPNMDVFLRIIAENGQILLDSGMGIGQTSWQGRIFVTQDITVQVIARGNATTFTLNTIIPEVITFEPGAVSATRAYPIAARDTHTFTLRALKGQTMAVWVTSSNGTVLLGIYGYEDGQPYKRTSVGDPSYTFVLPATQDYVIQVQSASDAPADFNLQVVVDGG